MRSMKIGLARHSYDMASDADVKLAKRIVTLAVTKKERNGVSHQTISFLKSTIRIIGYVALIQSVVLAIICLVISELLGIVEEIGH